MRTVIQFDKNTKVGGVHTRLTAYQGFTIDSCLTLDEVFGILKGSQVFADVRIAYPKMSEINSSTELLQNFLVGLCVIVENKAGEITAICSTEDGFIKAKKVYSK